MFYIRRTNRRGKVFRTNIDDNVFTRCPGCNAEIKVDLAELAEMDGGLDLYGVQVYCSRCTERRLTE